MSEMSHQEHPWFIKRAGDTSAIWRDALDLACRVCCYSYADTHPGQLGDDRDANGIKLGVAPRATRARPGR